jgi:THO complex subunit 2
VTDHQVGLLSIVLISSPCRVPFYASFWQLTAYDLSHPSERHNEEYNRLRGILKACNDKIQRRESTEADELKRSKVQIALNGFVSEAKTQIAHCAAINRRLEIEKLHWFSSGMMTTISVHLLRI